MKPNLRSRPSSRHLVVIAVAVLALAVVGCRDRTDGESGETPAPNPAATATSSATSKPDTATNTPEPDAESTSTAVPEPTPTAPPTIVDPAKPGPYEVGVFATSVSRTSSTGNDTRDLDTVVWYPASGGGAYRGEYQAYEDAPTALGGPFPVIVFSHGSGGNPAQSVFYTAHLAGHGFVVVALSHPGNTTDDCYPCVNVADLLDAARNRPDDVSWVMDALEDGTLLAGSTFADAIDLSRTGITGHSFGAWTTLISLAEDGRFLAGVSMAPNNAPLTEGRVRDVDVPVLMMSGGIDTVTPPDEQLALFGALPSDGMKYLLTLHRAGHPAFADRCLRIFSGCGSDDLPQEFGHQIINEYATAFLLTHVAGLTGYESYFAAGDVADGEATLESK